MSRSERMARINTVCGIAAVVLLGGFYGVRALMESPAPDVPDMTITEREHAYIQHMLSDGPIELRRAINVAGFAPHDAGTFEDGNLRVRWGYAGEPGCDGKVDPSHTLLLWISPKLWLRDFD